MDCKLDESPGESSAENASVNDIAFTDERGNYPKSQLGNVTSENSMLEDTKPALPILELNNLEKDSCEEGSGLPMANRVESGKLTNCREGNDNNLVEESPLRSHTMDESDDSEFILQDVKVCDICGDAGREDLLAICCRCSDGAEHTYCMRETLEKVPEGDWMCEDCRYDVEMMYQRQHKAVNVERSGNTSSGKASGGNSNACLKSDTRSGNDIGIISKDPLKKKILGKRPKEDAGVSSLFKRRAVESVIGSPKTSGSTTVASLTREVSFRNLDRGKEKLARQSSSRTPVGRDDTESAYPLVKSPRKLTPQGSFLKSNSFSSSNAKPKVKVGDEAVSLKQKLAPFDPKEGILKSYGKSMSFKSISSGRYGNGESKVKMLSPKFSHNQDSKGFTHTKERSVLERKSSFKSEIPGISSPRASSSISNFKNEKKLGFRDETTFSSESNNHRSRAVHSDSKPSSLSKIPSFSSRRASNNHVFAGHGKRQSLEAKPGYTNPNECVIDESAQPKDSVNTDETISVKDNQLKKNTGSGGTNETCQKCKKVAHISQCCSVDDLPDIATSKGLKEVTNDSNDLKAAIEAAMLRKPGICRKSRISDQSSDSSQSRKNCDIVSQMNFVSPVGKKNVYSGLVNNVVTTVKNPPTYYRPEAPDNVATFTCNSGDGSLPDPYDGKTSIKDFPLRPSSPISVLWKTSAIPEHEFTWQGNLEVRTNDKIECCDGVQAHLSACASSRVLRAVNNFRQAVVLNEASRLSTWPSQLQEYGVKEDNVALYFFAKDLDSYERSYKILLERMIKNDLALNGIIDGVELLIFPSTLLPQQSQRWNMLHFLWGVFRGKKSSQSYQLCQFPGQNHLQQNHRPTTVSLPENISSIEPVEKNLASNAYLVTEMSASKDRFDVSRDSSLVQVKETDKVNVETQGAILFSNAFTSLRSSSVKEERSDLKCKLEGGEIDASDQSFLKYASSRSESMPQLNELNCKCPHGDAKTISEATPTSRSQAIQIDEDEDVIVLGTHKRQKIDSDGSNSSNDQSRSSSDGFSMRLLGMASGSSSIVKGEAVVQKTTRSKWDNAERFFFPVDPTPVKHVGAADKSIPGKANPLENQVRMESPNLDLALGGETGLSTPGMTSFLVDKKVIVDDHAKEEEEDISRSLSLSLSFPFSGKEQDLTSIPAGQLTERPQLNPPFLLFGGIRDK